MTSKCSLLPLPQEFIQFDLSHLGQSSTLGFRGGALGLSPWAGWHLPSPDPFSALLSALEAPLPSGSHLGSAEGRTAWRSEGEWRESGHFFPALDHASGSGFISLPMSIASVSWSPVRLWFAIRNIHLTFVPISGMELPKPHTHTHIYTYIYTHIYIFRGGVFLICALSSQG